MITLREPALGSPAGHVDGQLRDVRQPVPDDRLLNGAVLRMGDKESGPVVAMEIRERIYPRKAPVHMHKSDSFRMALERPIAVAGRSYQELWILADRRGQPPEEVPASGEQPVVKEITRLAEESLA